ncbi:cytidylyltransferase domain-containing protein [Hoeflea sp.]|uniref:acylneuraminate cytidylyltransferase family protein n=1 Tax=Hoeflea sp. TaxID=1940281 RepID=UPI003747F2AE
MSRPECIALITGRGGSKRFPGKHTAPLGGKPLIAWSVEAALMASRMNRTIVSTDSTEIAAAAREAGAEVPFARPAELATDTVSNCHVMLHALNWLESESSLPDILCLCQATSPFRSAEDLDAAIAAFENHGADCLVSVTSATPPEHLLYLDEAGFASPASIDGAQDRQLQQLKPCFRPNGAIYLVRPESFRKRREILSERPLAHIMPAARSIDIDTAEDLALAEAMLQAGMLDNA